MDSRLLQRAIRPSRQYICSACRSTTSFHPSRIPILQRGFIRNNSKKSPQAHALTGYYSEILTPYKAPAPATKAGSASPLDVPIEKPSEGQERVRIGFPNKYAGPTARREENLRESTNIAGIVVPPKPTEPDNCCMSGCVNCVWDLYREEMEEWVVKSKDARTKIEEKKRGGLPADLSYSMDDDGGGSETNWESADTAGGDLFENIPVGIREFMKTEKMLKLQRKEAQARV